MTTEQKFKLFDTGIEQILKYYEKKLENLHGFVLGECTDSAACIADQIESILDDMKSEHCDDIPVEERKWVCDDKKEADRIIDAFGLDSIDYYEQGYAGKYYIHFK